jgi:hypothetical protein
MKREMLKERVELLEIGEALGYPRLGIGHSNGRKHSIRAGQSEWEKFCAHAHTTRIPAALRIGRILRDNGVIKFNPLASVTVEAVTPQGRPAGVTDKSEAATVPQASGIGSTPPPDLLDDVAELPKAEHTYDFPPGTVAVYPPGKRRRYPSKKNKARPS